ncbi:Helicase associated domain protein [Curtobacterium sp. Curtsp57]|uniref:Helicase associated domain protein n=1 Tax=Curtobacterium sp. Curtsp57 TaxID=3243047 RepID=UPI0039B502F4
MPTPTSALVDLWSEYETLSDLPTRQLTLDQRRSVDFFLADTDPTATVEPFVRRWIDRVHALDVFVEQHRRMPRADPRRPRPATEEQALVDAVAYFRQSHAAGTYVEYQTRRLEAVPGFAWSPRDAMWALRFAQHQAFWATRGFAPRRRAADPDEVTVGRWVAHQRALNARGALRPDRAARLRAARYRVL